MTDRPCERVPEAPTQDEVAALQAPDSVSQLEADQQLREWPSIPVDKGPLFTGKTKWDVPKNIKTIAQLAEPPPNWTTAERIKQSYVSAKGYWELGRDIHSQDI